VELAEAVLSRSKVVVLMEITNEAGTVNTGGGGGGAPELILLLLLVVQVDQVW
jgi:hypothetical protein